MKQLTRRRTRPVSLTKTRWTAYATAGAATAMVGIGTADADVHYSGVLNFTVPPGQSVSNLFALDNGAQLNFANVFTASSSGGGIALFQVQGAAVSAMFRGLAAGGFLYPSNLAAGANISGGAFVAFAGNFATLAYGGGYANSQFTAPGIGYLGFSFNGGSGTEYGWARVNMQGGPENGFTLIDYAWGDVGTMISAGQTAAIPEPGSLGLLAIGAVGLLAWRKRRTKASA